MMKMVWAGPDTVSRVNGHPSDTELMEGDGGDSVVGLPSLLASKMRSLPSLPAVVAQILQIISDPRGTVKDLNRIISSDVSITATILKVANSPMFGHMRKVSSLEQALKVLGFAEIQNLVLTKAVFNSFKSVKAGVHFDARRFWEHAFLCGLAARLINGKAQLKGTDLFVAGLIHDVGKLILYMAFPEQFSEIMGRVSPSDPRTSHAENTVIGCGHDKVGMDLLQRWMFPKSLIEAVGFHHRPHEAGDYRLHALIVCLADLLAHMVMRQGQEAEAGDCLRSELLHPEMLDLCRSSGLEWNDSVCTKVLEMLAVSREEESGTMELFFS